MFRLLVSFKITLGSGLNFKLVTDLSKNIQKGNDHTHSDVENLMASTVVPVEKLLLLLFLSVLVENTLWSQVNVFYSILSGFPFYGLIWFILNVLRRLLR